MDWKTLNFDWNRARAFLVTAEEGSLSAGARALNMSQPTLGRQVAGLEEELGVTLFERVGNHLVLTDNGLELLQQVRQMGQAASQLSIAASGQSQTLEGSVCISVGEIDGLYRLPPVVERIRQEQPGIELEIIVSNEVSDLKRREADIAIRSFRPQQPDLITRRLTMEKIWLMGTPAYLSQFPGPHTSESLSGLNILGFDKSDRVIQQLQEKGWQLTPKHFPVLSTFQPFQLQMAKRGFGLAIAPEEVSQQEPELTIAFQEHGPLFELPLWLVCHRELHTSMRVRKVFDYLVDMLAD